MSKVNSVLEAIRSENEAPMIVLQCRVPASLIGEIEALGGKWNVSRSELVRELLRAGLREAKR